MNFLDFNPCKCVVYFSWHLKQVLHSLMYTHLSEYHRASLHMNFASHLESLGLWEWAVFVSLHIDNPVR